MYIGSVRVVVRLSVVVWLGVIYWGIGGLMEGMGICGGKSWFDEEDLTYSKGRLSLLPLSYSSHYL